MVLDHCLAVIVSMSYANSLTEATPDQCSSITSQVYEAISCLNQYCFDIKPANVFYIQDEEDLTIAIGDLGSNNHLIR